MRRLKLVVVILLVLSLNGCVQKYTASEKQTGAVAEYMAELILKKDRDYDQELVTEDDKKDNSSMTDNLTVTPVPTKPQNGDITGITTSAGTTGDNTNNTNEAPANTKEQYTLSQLIGDKNFDINYKSYKLADTYPDKSEDAMFVLTHSEGYKLLIITFSIKNTSNKKQALNLMDHAIDYKLDVNKGTRYSPLLPLLENDLRYIDMKFDGGKTGKGLLFFEVSEKTKISDINLIATKGNKTAIIEMN